MSTQEHQTTVGNLGRNTKSNCYITQWFTTLKHKVQLLASGKGRNGNRRTKRSEGKRECNLFSSKFRAEHCHELLSDFLLSLDCFFLLFELSFYSFLFSCSNASAFICSIWSSEFADFSSPISPCSTASFYRISWISTVRSVLASLNASRLSLMVEGQIQGLYNTLTSL